MIKNVVAVTATLLAFPLLFLFPIVCVHLCRNSEKSCSHAYEYVNASNLEPGAVLSNKAFLTRGRLKCFVCSDRLPRTGKFRWLDD